MNEQVVKTLEWLVKPYPDGITPLSRALSRDFDLAKYNPDQPRDDHGRFGSGGGESNSKTPADGSSKGLAAGSKGDSTTPKDYPKGTSDPITPNMPLHEHLVADGQGGWKPDAERQALWDGIKSSFREGVPTSDHPKVDMLGGGPAAGKTTLTESGLVPTRESLQAVYVAPDDIKMMLPEMQDGIAAGDTRIGENMHEESSILGKQILADSMAAGQNIVVDGTGDTSVNSLTGKVEAMQAAGYEVNGHYVTLPTNEAVGRMYTRGDTTGRYLDESTTRAIHTSVSSILPEMTSKFDSVRLYDNTGVARGGQAPIIMSSTKDGGTTVQDPAAYDRFLNKAGEDTGTLGREAVGAGPAPLG